ncbi:MAG TPA: FKBP-type peptidyl-prolyl cis-trans isomerase [Polyangiaceae bacterium]|jgi:peptidylprolyl isomerase|nr:FKBP-type peptidyl-prolyl cis-trans isomerase [Polyangiaceae bacterium]
MRTKLMPVLVAGGISLIVLAACSRSPEEPTSDFKPAQGTPLPPGPTTLEKEDLTVGTGREAKDGDTVHVQYTGTLTNGKKFDSSYDHGGDPFKVTIGKGEVIKGWDQGLPGMKVGGKRRLRIPAELGYGAAGSGPDIPPNAGLVFDIELVSID